MKNYFLPKARTNNLLVQDLPNELLIYDLNKNRAVCLNQTARLIFESCDGKTTFDEVKNQFGKSANISNDIIWVTLEKFKNAGLLNEKSLEIPKISRRNLMKTGLVLSISLPLVTSLIAPLAVNAQSVTACVPDGGLCTVDLQNNTTDCCPGRTCTTNINGICCIILTGICDSTNDFCCPSTHCDSNTNLCVTNI